MASGGLAMSLGDFVPDGAGIVEVWTSAGMQAALAEAASRMAAQADALAHLSHDPVAPDYAHGVDVLDRTAVGYVMTGNVQAMVDQAAHKTLDAINH